MDIRGYPYPCQSLSQSLQLPVGWPGGAALVAIANIANTGAASAGQAVAGPKNLSVLAAPTQVPTEPTPRGGLCANRPFRLPAAPAKGGELCYYHRCGSGGMWFEADREVLRLGPLLISSRPDGQLGPTATVPAPVQTLQCGNQSSEKANDA